MNRLTEKHFSFQCPMNWDEMEISAQGRFCNQCRKEVFDLTNCSIDEVRVLQQKHGRICGTVRLLGTATVAAALASAACRQEKRDVGQMPAPIPEKPPQVEIEPPALMGDIMVIPEKVPAPAKPTEESETPP